MYTIGASVTFMLIVSATAFFALRNLALRTLRSALDEVKRAVREYETKSTEQFMLICARIELLEDQLTRLKLRLDRMAGNVSR